MPEISAEIQKGNTNKWNNLILHLHPKFVPEKALKFTLTFGLGGMAALLFIIQALTGLLLRFAYVPSPEGAFDSILHINNEVLFGSLVRNIHRWSGTLLVLIVFLHMLRVLFTGAYTQKRASNWTIGVCLLLLVVFSNFSGYLLPWDQLAYWAVTVSTGMLNYIPVIGKYINHFIVQGTEVGAPTLLVFYTMHTGILPLTIVVLMSFHFWKTRKAGGVVIPESTDSEIPKKVLVIPNLIIREFVVAMVLIAFILFLATFFNAPLGEEANPTVTPNPTKAPWYFLGFQELILHFHPVIAVFILPLSILLILFYLPNIKNNNPNKGVWFLSQTGKNMAIKAALSAVIISPFFILIDEYILKNLPLFKHGILTLVLFLVFVISGTIWMKNNKNISKAELIQTLSVFIIVTFLVLTITGIFFRGEGMKLIF
jgi:quinol-cytochrome oxidoreductase complex cytochrome b subunit